MNANVNIEDVKKYNTTLKQYKEAASKLQAEKDFLLSEIDAACNELSAELGIEVTRDNIVSIRDDLCSKINSSLQSGNAVLAKIASETSKPSTTGIGAGETAQIPTQEMQVRAEAVNQPAPVEPVVSGEAVQFNDGNLVGGSNGATLPPLFGI